MSALCQVPVTILDELTRLECRVAFLNMAFLAIYAMPEGDRRVDAKAWEGLYYWTQDIEDSLRELNELTRQE